LPAAAQPTDRLHERSTDEEVRTVSESEAEVQDTDVIETGEIGRAVGTCSRQQSADNWTDGGGKTSPVRKCHASRQKKSRKVSFVKQQLLILFFSGKFF